MQSHRYGQSIVAEVLAPNQATATAIFERELKYQSLPIASEPSEFFTTYGKFFVCRIPIFPPTADKMVPRKLRLMRGITGPASLSPFPDHPGKNVPLVYQQTSIYPQTPTKPSKPIPQKKKPVYSQYILNLRNGVTERPIMGGLHGTCDWGGCDLPANKLREGLPVCDKHSIQRPVSVKPQVPRRKT